MPLWCTRYTPLMLRLWAFRVYRECRLETNYWKEFHVSMFAFLITSRVVNRSADNKRHIAQCTKALKPYLEKPSELIPPLLRWRVGTCSTKDGIVTQYLASTLLLQRLSHASWHTPADVLPECHYAGVCSGLFKNLQLKSPEVLPLLQQLVPFVVLLTSFGN